jgi:hypothetical protein
MGPPEGGYRSPSGVFGVSRNAPDPDRPEGGRHLERANHI